MRFGPKYISFVACYSLLCFVFFSLSLSLFLSFSVSLSLYVFLPRTSESASCSGSPNHMLHGLQAGDRVLDCHLWSKQSVDWWNRRKGRTVVHPNKHRRRRFLGETNMGNSTPEQLAFSSPPSDANDWSVKERRYQTPVLHLLDKPCLQHSLE